MTPKKTNANYLYFRGFDIQPDYFGLAPKSERFQATDDNGEGEIFASGASIEEVREEIIDNDLYAIGHEPQEAA